MVQTVLLVVLLMFTELDLYALVICLIVYSFLMCVLNSICVRRYLGVKEDFKTMFLLPFLSALLMGICARGVYMGLSIFVKSNVICLIPGGHCLCSGDLENWRGRGRSACKLSKREISGCGSEKEPSVKGRKVIPFFRWLWYILIYGNENI